jgi:hypothetical protein
LSRKPPRRGADIEEESVPPVRHNNFPEADGLASALNVFHTLATDVLQQRADLHGKYVENRQYPWLQWLGLRRTDFDRLYTQDQAALQALADQAAHLAVRVLDQRDKAVAAAAKTAKP